MNPVTRAFDAVVDDVNKVDRSIVAKINTVGVDRYRTVIDPRGGKFVNYRANPAVLWEHGKDPRRFTDPIGRNLWIKHDGGGGRPPTHLLARTQFLKDDFSQQRFEWYQDGTLNAFSVNILPEAERCGPPDRQELRDFPEWEGAETIYRGWDLAEYSGTTIPGNADCLAERAGKFADLVNRGLLWLPDETAEIVARYITHSDGKWIVHAEDGKVLGEHDSKESAEKQLAAIEAHKHDEGRSAPWIEADGASWMVYAAPGRIVAAYRDQAIAEEALALMNMPSKGDAFSRLLLRSMAEQQTRDERRADDLIARIELQFFGRV